MHGLQLSQLQLFDLMRTIKKNPIYTWSRFFRIEDIYYEVINQIWLSILLDKIHRYDITEWLSIEPVKCINGSYMELLNIPVCEVLPSHQAFQGGRFHLWTN